MTRPIPTKPAALARYNRICDLHHQGLAWSAIGAQTGSSESTVSRTLATAREHNDPRTRRVGMAETEREKVAARTLPARVTNLVKRGRRRGCMAWRLHADRFHDTEDFP